MKCKNCGGALWARSAKVMAAMEFCTYECRRQFVKKTGVAVMKCARCGEALTPERIRFTNRNAKQRFCSELCARVYRQNTKYKHSVGPCKSEGCERMGRKNGYCSHHYYAMKGATVCERCDRLVRDGFELCKSCRIEADEVAKVTAKRGIADYKPTPWDQPNGYEGLEGGV